MARENAFMILNQYFEDESFLNIALNEQLIKWNLHEDVEAYTTTRKLGDISLNNPNYLKVLENRQELASLLNTDLEHIGTTIFH